MYPLCYTHAWNLEYFHNKNSLRTKQYSNILIIYLITGMQGSERFSSSPCLAAWHSFCGTTAGIGRSQSEWTKEEPKYYGEIVEQ